MAGTAKLIDTLKIYGIGFEEHNKSCWYKHLLEQLSLKFQSMEITNTIPHKADVIILNATQKLTLSILQAQVPDENCYVILIAHDVSHITSAFMKFADYVIYINELQQYVYEDFLELAYPSCVLPYPFADLLIKKEESFDCLIYFEGDDFKKDYAIYEEQIKMALTWHPYDIITHYYLLFEVAPTENVRFEKFRQLLTESDSRFKIFNATELTNHEIYDIASRCFCGQLFKPESTTAEYVTFLENRDPKILYDTLSESKILPTFQNLNLIIAPSLEKSFYNFNAEQKSTCEEWNNTLYKILEDNLSTSIYEKEKVRKEIVVDSVKDLNIIWGQPLKNKFVFSVCFRNQEDRIIRCLESIIDQSGHPDIGIAIISDSSTDNSVPLIMDFVKRHNTEVCIVDNKERKMVSRNFYNVAHNLVVNNESIIIEVDGDDFLADKNVLSILASYYNKGALKTNGSYKIYPDNHSFESSSDTECIHNRFDVTNPWSIQCPSWLHLRSIKRHLLCQVELDYFLEKKSKKWLSEGHDSATQPRMIELAKEKAVFVKEVLYCYDRSGDAHEVTGSSRDEDMIYNYKKMNRYFHLIDMR